MSLDVLFAGSCHVIRVIIPSSILVFWNTSTAPLQFFVRHHFGSPPIKWQSKVVSPCPKQGGLTYSCESRSSPSTQSWQWRSLAARGRALRTGDICCPWKRRFSSPQSQRSCKGWRWVLNTVIWPKLTNHFNDCTSSCWCCDWSDSMKNYKLTLMQGIHLFSTCDGEKRINCCYWHIRTSSPYSTLFCNCTFDLIGMYMIL